MPEQPNEFPSDNFKRNYTEHATRITESVTAWYQLGVNQFIVNAPSLLHEVTRRFFITATDHPEDVYINGTPLSFALAEKRSGMLERFKHIPPAVYIARFGQWFNSNLTNDNNPEKRTAIERIAATHVFQWLGMLPENLKRDKEVWDHVDESISSALNNNRQQIHPAGEVLLSCIHAAVIEQFITDEYAPANLFGSNTTQ